DQHRVFFGRAEEIKVLVEQVRSTTEGQALLIVGPSGCGKSSLVRAGLLPVLAGEPGWLTLPPILPGADPVTALARELAAAARQIGLDWTVEHVQQQLDAKGLTALADELLLADPDGPRRRLLLVVDQFEELLTQTLSGQRARFAELLGPALSGPVQVVCTLRLEFLDQLLLDPALAAVPTHTHTLRPLRREALRAVIEEPARLAGIDLDEGLADRLVDDTDSGEALPLLAFTLAQLADGVGRGGRLSAARYDQLGGVQGALTHQADAALADAVTSGGRYRDQVIAGLLRLITVDEQGRPTRWRVNRAELPDQVVTELDTFVARRLLTTDSDNGTVLIGVAHEAFLSAWLPLVEAITASVSALRARRTVEHAAAGWHNSGRPPSRLWGGGQLAAAVADTGARIRTRTALANPGPRQGPARWLPRHHRVLITGRIALSPMARDFLHTSIRRDRYRRSRAIIVLSVLLILALTAAGTAIVQRDRAQEGERIATARQLITQADAIRAIDPRTALRLGIAAERLHSGSETQVSLFNTLFATRYAGILTAHTDWVNTATFSSDGNMLATGDSSGSVILWDLNPAQPRQLGPPLDHTDAVNSVAFSADGHTLAVAIGETLAGSSRGEGAVILWNLTDSAQPRQLGSPLRHAEAVHSVAFSSDGHTLATASAGNVQLWDLTSPTQSHLLASPPDHYGRVEAVAFSPHGRAVAAVSTTAVLLWDLTNLSLPHQLDPPLNNFAGSKLSVAFSPEGHVLAAAGSSSVRVWDLTNLAEPAQLDPPPDDIGNVQSVVFSPDAHILAFATANSVFRWDITGATPLDQLNLPLDHNGGVASAAFSPDTYTLITTSADGDVLLWNIASATQPHQFDPPPDYIGDISPDAISPDGRILATSGDLVGSGEVFLWDLTNPARPEQIGPVLNALSLTLYSAAFSLDGRTLATAHGGFGDGEVNLWDVTNPAQPHQIGTPLTTPNGSILSVTFSPDGHILATASEEGAVLLWDLTNPAQPRQLGPSSNPIDGVFSVMFAPNRDMLAIIGANRVLLWDLTNPAEPVQLGQSLEYTDTVSSAAFAPDGNTLAIASANRVILWDLTDPTQPHQLSQSLEHTDTVSSVAFAPNGRTLATGNLDNTATALLWDLTNPAQPVQLGPPLDSTGRVLSVTFTRDGRTLATGSDGSTTSLWDLTSLDYLRDHVTERACAITGGGLTPEEWERYIPDLLYQDTCPA
ncbi:MAG: AAA family ATPase, partial [Pseudonocardiaceae bacterium]